MSLKNGIKGNSLIRKVEPLISVDQLRALYLFGVRIQDNDGNNMPDSTYQAYIDNAVSWLEHHLDVSIIPETIIEPRDYRANEYWDWGYFQLDNIPVANISKLEVVYLQDGLNQPDTVLDIPLSWIRLDEHSGIVRLIPNTKFPASLQVDQFGLFFPELFRRHNMVPNLWRFTYQYGFEDGKIPKAINMAIGLLAAIQALNIAGDLVIGAGIAGQSIGTDGLSESIQTTSSAENHAYSAKVKEYQRQLYGTVKDDPNGLLMILREYYQGEIINIV